MEKSGSERFYFIGNSLALDFLNTLIVDENGDRLELLKSFDDLVDWALAGGIVNAERALALKRRSKRGQESKSFQQAILFRGELKNMAVAIACGKRVPPSAIEAINGVLSRSNGHFELFSTPSGYVTRFRMDEQSDPEILLLIAESAAKLLSEGDLSRVRKCQRSACVLYFYDNSKRHGRRWCSMSACGNRAKAAAHYKRTSRNQ